MISRFVSHNNSHNGGNTWSLHAFSKIISCDSELNMHTEREFTNLTVSFNKRET